MTDEAKALVEALRPAETDRDHWGYPTSVKVARKAADLIETQAREIERLRDVLREVLDHARHANDCAIYHRTRKPCSCGFEADDEAARATLGDTFEDFGQEFEAVWDANRDKLYEDNTK